MRRAVDAQRRRCAGASASEIARSTWSSRRGCSTTSPTSTGPRGVRARSPTGRRPRGRHERRRRLAGLLGARRPRSVRAAAHLPLGERRGDPPPSLRPGRAARSRVRRHLPRCATRSAGYVGSSIAGRQYVDNVPELGEPFVARKLRDGLHRRERTARVPRMIRPAELIEEKRNGGEHDPAELDGADPRLRARRGARLPDGRLVHGGLLQRA